MTTTTTTTCRRREMSSCSRRDRPSARASDRSRRSSRTANRRSSSHTRAQALGASEADRRSPKSSCSTHFGPDVRLSHRASCRTIQNVHFQFGFYMHKQSYWHWHLYYVLDCRVDWTRTCDRIIDVRLVRLWLNNVTCVWCGRVSRVLANQIVTHVNCLFVCVIYELKNSTNKKHDSNRSMMYVYLLFGCSSLW